MPVVSARQMLKWLDGRNGSSFNSLSWNGNKLDFTIDVGAGANGLRAMVPTTSAVGALTGVEARRRPGRRPRRGRSRASSTRSSTPPPGATRRPTRSTTRRRRSRTSPTRARRRARATITWDTDEPSDSRVDYGTNPSRPRLEPERARRWSTSHSVELTGLDAEHDLLLPGDVDATPPATPRPSRRHASAPRSFTTPSASLTDTTVADFGAGTHRRQHLRLRDRRRRGDPEADRGRGVLRRPGSAGRLDEPAPGILRRRLRRQRDRLRRQRSTSTAPAPGPAATYGSGRALEFGATFGGRDLPARRLRRRLQQRRTGRSSASRATAASTPAPTIGASQADTRSPEHADRRRRTATGSSGTRPRSATTSTAAWSPPTPRTSAPPRCARPPATSTPAAPSVAVDWLHMSPYPASGSFDSRVFDAGQSADWGALTLDRRHARRHRGRAQRPHRQHADPGRELERVHPDRANGGDIPGNSRYLQYRAEPEHRATRARRRS